MSRILLTLLLTLALAACGGTGPEPAASPETTPVEETTPRTEPLGPPLIEAPAEPAGETRMDTGETGNVTGPDLPETGTGEERPPTLQSIPRMETGPAPLGTPAPSMAMDDAVDSGVMAVPQAKGMESGDRHGPRVPPRPRQQPGNLKAGEVDDNARWNEYLDYTLEYAGRPVHVTPIHDRVIIQVVDREGMPVPNARVQSSHGEGKAQLTYADGRTMFFPVIAIPDALGIDRSQYTTLHFTAERDGFKGRASLDLDRGYEAVIQLDGEMAYGQVPLDVLFLVDSTGSMADEIRRIKQTLKSIAQRIRELPANPDLRFAMLSYRDRGDDYVTRLYDFDPDVERFRQAISQVEAEGGGDYPESLNRALNEAVNDADWRQDAIRIILLVADAPPHLDYEQDEDYAKDMVRARQKGIKIFAVASSGLDDQGEYVFRQLAQQTMGRFIFILYETGYYGELETPHEVEQYTVNRLDDLVVKLVEGELENLGRTANGGMKLNP